MRISISNKYLISYLTKMELTTNIGREVLSLEMVETGVGRIMANANIRDVVCCIMNEIVNDKHHPRYKLPDTTQFNV